MREKIFKFIKDCITGIDGQTHDVGRVLWIVAFLVGIGLAIAGFWTGKQFDLQAYGLGVGALLVAGGASLKLKATTEPTS